MPAHAENPPSSPGSPPGRAAEVIRAWRLRMSMTQEELAQALNVTFSTVSRWENGHVQPSKLAWRALQQLAEARGCPLDEGHRAHSA
jgi:putative transcriptional regulator